MGARPLCPSAPLTGKARLIGVVTGGGAIAFTGARRVDDAFVTAAREGPVAAEERFRFAAPCARQGCGNWDSGGCSLPARVLADLREAPGQGWPLAECGIREACVWFAQSGAAACRGCRFVVTRINTEQTREHEG